MLSFAFPKTLAAPEGKKWILYWLEVSKDKTGKFTPTTQSSISLKSDQNVHTKTGKQMYAGAFFIKTPNWNKLKCLTTAKQALYIFKNEIRSGPKKQNANI